MQWLAYRNAAPTILSSNPGKCSFTFKKWYISESASGILAELINYSWRQISIAWTSDSNYLIYSLDLNIFHVVSLSEAFVSVALCGYVFGVVSVSFYLFFISFQILRSGFNIPTGYSIQFSLIVISNFWCCKTGTGLQGRANQNAFNLLSETKLQSGVLLSPTLFPIKTANGFRGCRAGLLCSLEATCACR